MNNQQKQTCLTIINEIKEYDLKKIILESFTNENDFTKIMFSKYSAADFIELFDKMVSQLEYELTEGLGLLLPNTENYQNDFGNIDLVNNLTRINGYLKAKNFNSLETYLERLIHYQVKNGFWNKTILKASKIEQKKLEKQYELIAMNQDAIDINLGSFDKLIQLFQDEISKVEKIISDKEDELSAIAFNLKSSTVNSNEIEGLLSNVKNKDTEISGVVDVIKSKLREIETDITNYEESFSSIDSGNKLLEKELLKSLENASNNFEKSKENIEFAESKREEIEKLTGMAADGALGSKFHERETKLTDNLPFWKWAILGMTIISVGWVVAVFTFLPSSFDEQWLNFVVNLLKTSPAFILLGFVIKQYSKERNLEEEYAFKSAVAMTLTAYSGMLSEKDIEKNVSRQKMLFASIERLYNQPKIHAEKNGTLFSFNTKKLKDSVDSLGDSINKFK